MPNECKHEAKPLNSEVREMGTSEDEHSAINREENKPKAILLVIGWEYLGEGRRSLQVIF